MGQFYSDPPPPKQRINIDNKPLTGQMRNRDGDSQEKAAEGGGSGRGCCGRWRILDDWPMDSTCCNFATCTVASCSRRTRWTSAPSWSSRASATATSSSSALPRSWRRASSTASRRRPTRRSPTPPSSARYLHLRRVTLNEVSLNQNESGVLGLVR